MIIPARYLQADLTETIDEDVAFSFTDVNCQAGKGLHLWYLTTDNSIHSKDPIGLRIKVWNVVKPLH